MRARWGKLSGPALALSDNPLDQCLGPAGRRCFRGNSSATCLWRPQVLSGPQLQPLASGSSLLDCGTGLLAVFAGDMLEKTVGHSLCWSGLGRAVIAS
jgi:hypothetical protein